MPAFANTAFTTWQFIDSTPYSCGYYRNHVDNSGYLAAATTKNVVYYSGNPCNQSNGLTALPTNYLRVNVNLIDEDGQWLCGASGNVYNAGGSASSVAVTVNYVANAGCQLHAGDYFHASGSGARWNTTLGGYVSNGSITSPHLPFN